MDIQKQITDARKIIDALPQRQHISDETIDQWINNVISIEPERLVWHALRARGIGGSEMGCLIEYFRGDYNAGNPAQGNPFLIIGGKLLTASPDGGSGDTQRGTFLEDEAGRLFLDKYNATRDQESIDKVLQATPSEEHPWLVGNPDDIVIMDGKRYITDYKVPRSHNLDELLKKGVKLDYYSQLHHYTAVCRQLNIQIDGLILAPMCTNEWEVFGQEIAINEDFIKELKHVGDHYWDNHVINAHPLPKKIATPDAIVIPSSQVTQPVAVELNGYARLRALKDALEAELKEKKEELESLFNEGINAAEAKLEYGGLELKLGTKSVMKKKSVIDTLHAYGSNLDACIKTGIDKYDDKTLLKALDDLNLPKEEHQLLFEEKRKASLGVTLKKKGVNAEIKFRMRENATNVVKNISKKIESEAKKGLTDLSNPVNNNTIETSNNLEMAKTGENHANSKSVPNDIRQASNTLEL